MSTPIFIKAIRQIDTKGDRKMFVKIIYWDVEKEVEKVTGTTTIHARKLNREVIYDCNSVQFVEDNRKEPEESAEKIMNIIMDDGFKTVEIPMDSPDQAFEIFLMNDHGKTIDRYCY